MIQEDELMKGNWVLNGDKPKQILAILGDESVELNLDLRNYVWLSECHPVELTPEILEKAGFEYHKTEEEVTPVEYWQKKTEPHKYRFGTFYFSLVKWEGCELTFSHHTIRTECKYLHQLQNLYFILTNQPLKIEL